MRNLVRKRRKELDMTQEKLSEISNVSRATISLIENNALKSIESTTMFKLAIALNCDIGDIFFEENVVFTKQ